MRRPHARRLETYFSATAGQPQRFLGIFARGFTACEAHGGEALTVYTLDEAIPDEAKEVRESDERIIEARYIELNGAE